MIISYKLYLHFITAFYHLLVALVVYSCVSKFRNVGPLYLLLSFTFLAQLGCLWIYTLLAVLYEIVLVEYIKSTLRDLSFRYLQDIFQRQGYIKQMEKLYTVCEITFTNTVPNYVNFDIS